MRKRVSRILAVTLATVVTVTAMPSEAEAAFRSFDSVPKAVSQAISQAASQKEIRYFPVTLYDYDQETINQAVYQEDKAENPNSRVLRGIYFSNGAPGSSYATWNTWTGLLTTNNTISSTQTSQKGYVYSGLVGSDMQNGNIHFTVPDGGIFDSGDTKTKEVYTNVGLPFVYENRYYTFDASQDSAYFSGTAASETNLTWNDTAQTNKTDNRKGFYPFNSGTSVRTPDYHFGMIATIPFSMTADGKISSTSDEDIKFELCGYLLTENLFWISAASTIRSTERLILHRTKQKFPRPVPVRQAECLLKEEDQQPERSQKKCSGILKVRVFLILR